MMLLLLVIALGFVGAAPLEDDKVCKPHSRPWQATLDGDGITCSAALINEWWLVTSFSCNPRAHTTMVYLGKHDVTVVEGTEQRIPVALVVQHSPYRSPLHSLTMIRLAEPARFTLYVQPIPLPTRCPKPEETCSVSGWGSTTSNHYEPHQYLKCLTVPVVDDQTCEESFPQFIYWSTGMFCAGRNGTDNCLADGCGIVECNGELQGLQWFNHGCYDPVNPTVYTKLCRYTRWINDVMSTFRPTTHPPTTAEMPPVTRTDSQAE